MDAATVYMTKDIQPTSLIRLYEAVGLDLPGNILMKVHSGEAGNQNFLRPSFFAPIQERLHGTIGECNTAYAGARTNNADHRRLFEEHGWTAYFDVDLLDEDGDMELPIPNGKAITVDYVGDHISRYDSLLVLTHFKGHPMGGFGGALKQLSIGLASSRGKVNIHTAGAVTDQRLITDWTGGVAAQDDFLQAMADAAGAVSRHFAGRAVYLSTMANMSVDCDCCAVAEDPCMADVGILASTDPIAIDRACLDLVHASTDPGRDHLLARIDRQHGEQIIPDAVEQGFGTDRYELVSID